jgi:hypothetical protein
VTFYLPPPKMAKAEELIFYLPPPKMAKAEELN